MVENVTSILPEAYSQSKTHLLLNGSFEHSQGLQQVQELLGIGLRMVHPETKIDPSFLATIPAGTEHTAIQMKKGEIHDDFQGVDPHKEPISRLRDMIGIVNEGKLPTAFVRNIGDVIPLEYAPNVVEGEELSVPSLEQGDWVWYGILYYMVERDNHYLKPNALGRVLGRPGDPSKRDIYDSQFCRLILQQDQAYTQEYTEIMREVRKFLQRELPHLKEKDPQLYNRISTVIEQYNTLSHNKPVEKASWEQLQETNKSEE